MIRHDLNLNTADTLLNIVDFAEAAEGDIIFDVFAADFLPVVEGSFDGIDVLQFKDDVVL